MNPDFEQNSLMVIDKCHANRLKKNVHKFFETLNLFFIIIIIITFFLIIRIKYDFCFVKKCTH